MVILCRGDITRRDDVLWGFGIEEAQPWLRHLQREIVFQEAILEQWCGIRFAADTAPRRAPAWPERTPGAACAGARVAECLRTFGGGLALACSTCGTDYERTGRLQ